jgi:hypothetical protein
MRKYLGMLAAYLVLVFNIRGTSASININVEAVQKSVIFLYGSDSTGSVDSSRPLGTGFIVQVPSLSDPKRSYTFMITARHIVDPEWAGCGQPNSIVIYARLNKKSYVPDPGSVGVDFVPVQLRNDKGPIWFHHPDGDIDAAVVPLPGQKLFDEFDAASIKVEDFPTDAELGSQSIGDPVMSAGLLPALTEANRNYPIFKFGQISNIPQEDIETQCAPHQPIFPVRVWLIAANLVAGNSGSPIFHVPLGGYGVSFGGRPMLLGVQSISFPGVDVAGMTPIKYVFEILQNIGLQDPDLRRGPVLPSPSPQSSPAK